MMLIGVGERGEQEIHKKEVPGGSRWVPKRSRVMGGGGGISRRGKPRRVGRNNKTIPENVARCCAALRAAAAKRSWSPPWASPAVVIVIRVRGAGGTRNNRRAERRVNSELGNYVYAGGVTVHS